MTPLHTFLQPPSARLEEHAAYLYSLRATACVVPRISAIHAVWHPLAGICHQNCSEWENLYPDDTTVSGWLCFDFSPLGFFRFASHAIIKMPPDQLIDITPAETQANRPFLEDSSMESVYDQYITELYHMYGVTLLDHKL